MPTPRFEGKRVEERMGEGKRERKGERERQRTHAGEKERERESALAPPFICLPSTWACPVQTGLSRECCLFYLKSSLWSSDLPLPFLVFWPPPFWTPFPYSTYLTEWKLTFSSSMAITEFSRFAGILSTALWQHHLLGFEIAQLEFHYLH